MNDMFSILRHFVFQVGMSKSIHTFTDYSHSQVEYFDESVFTKFDKLWDSWCKLIVIIVSLITCD